MQTESEVRLQRYRQIEREADKFGRLIGVRRLKPSEQTRVATFTADITGYDVVTGPKGEEIRVPHRMPLLIVAAVCEIDRSPIPFPKNRAELDAIFDRLDEEGLAAASVAMARLDRGDGALNPKDEAKN